MFSLSVLLIQENDKRGNKNCRSSWERLTTKNVIAIAVSEVSLTCIIHERIEKKPESLMPSGIWEFDSNNSLRFLSITNY